MLPSRRLHPARPALVACLAFAASASAADLVRLPQPSFKPPSQQVFPTPGSLQLTLAESRRNAITDVRAWFRRNRIVPAEWAVGDGDVPAAPLPAVFSPTYRGLPLRRAVNDGAVALLLYGRDPGGGRFVVGADPRTGATRYAFDLDRFAYAPQTVAGERPYARQNAVWAAERGDVLYVETAHSTYARSSGGRNAYLTAIDLERRRIRWRSAALVANAETFALAGNSIVAGYGFTGEADGLYVLDRRTGRTVGSLPVPSAPEYLAIRRGKLFVRAYDRDLVLRLRVPG